MGGWPPYNEPIDRATLIPGAEHRIPGFFNNTHDRRPRAGEMNGPNTGRPSAHAHASRRVFHPGFSRETEMSFAQKFLAKAADLATMTATFTLGNGSKVSLDVGALPETVRKQLMLHGALQKIGDAAAGSSKSNDFLGALAKMQAIVEALQAGDWSVKGNGETDLAVAVSRVMGITAEEATAKLESLSEEQYKAIMSHAAVKEQLLLIKADRAKAQANDTADLTKLLGM